MFKKDSRLYLLLLVMTLSILTFALKKRYFPFSDYPMFSYARKDTHNFALVLKEKNQNLLFLNNEALRPVTRLSIHQRIVACAKNNLGFEWVKIYADKIENKKHLQSLLVVRANYDLIENKNVVEEVLYEYVF